LFNAVSFNMTGNGPYIVPTSAINPADGTGVNQGGPAFSGELFSNPGPGQLGTLQRRMFSGPWTFDIDGSVKKQIEISERVNAEIRMDAYNALNHATFWVGDQNINTNTFGEVSSMFFNPRVLQFGAYLKF
jgi:hypothetical protein